MAKTSSLFFCILLLFSTVHLFGQGANCRSAQPMCSDLPITFPASTNVTSTDLTTSALRGCLGSAPNPAWYFLKIGNPGPINIYISQFSGTIGQDVDFACWGPFNTDDWNSICVAQLGNSSGAGSHRPSNGDHQNGANMGGYPRPAPSKMIDCSFFGNFTEWCYIPNAKRGEYYLLCLTNFSNRAGQMSFERLPLTNSGTTDCSILPAAAEGDTICYGSSVKIKIPRTKPSESYNVILPTGGTYPPAKVQGTGAAVTITIPANLVVTLRKGVHTFEVVTWEGTTASAPIPIAVLVEELDTKVLSYWKEPAADNNKGVAICPGTNLRLGFNVSGANVPVNLTDEVPPRFYERIGTTTSYIFLGTGNLGQYQYTRQVNTNEFYAVDRETEFGKCKMSKQTVRVIKGSTPKVKIFIKDGVTPNLPPPPATDEGQKGNQSNDDPTLPATATVNTDGYWSPLSANPWIMDRGINPIPNKGTLENDPVKYTVEGEVIGSGKPIIKSYFFGIPGSGTTNTYSVIDRDETTMTGVVVDGDGCEGRLDTTILRLKPPKIRIALTNADTTVCGNDMVEIKAKIVSVEDDSYFPLTFRWQTIDPITFLPLGGMPINHPTLGPIGDGGNGNGNGDESTPVTLANRNSVITFKVRVGTLFKVHAETRKLPTGIYNPDGTEQTNTFKSSSYFAKVNRLPLPKSTDLTSFEREIKPGSPPKIEDIGYSYFCSGVPVMIKGAGVRDYVWTVTTPDDPNPVVVGRTREVKISEAINHTPGVRTVKLNMVGYNGCANDTSFTYQILPLPTVTVQKTTADGTGDECLNQTKTLTALASTTNDSIFGNDPRYPSTSYPPVSDKNYEWKPAYNTDPNPPIGKEIKVFPDSAQIYAVTYKDARGCIVSWVDSVGAPVRIRGFANKSQYCLGDDIQLDGKIIGTTVPVTLQNKSYFWVKNSADVVPTPNDGKVLGSEIESFCTTPNLYKNGGWELLFVVKGDRNGCSGYDTVKVKIRPKPNFDITVKGDAVANVSAPSGFPSFSGDPWEIKDVTQFAIVALKFKESMKDTTAQYAVKTTTDWNITTTVTDVTRVDYPEGINNSADTVQKITPKSIVEYKITVKNEWYNLFVGDTLRCTSDPEYLEIAEPAGIKIVIPTPPEQNVDTTRFGQKIMTICQDAIELLGVTIKVQDKNNSNVKKIKNILWYRVKLENGKYIPTHGGYVPTFPPGQPTGSLGNCSGGEWDVTTSPITVKLPTTPTTTCLTRMPPKGDFSKEGNKGISDSFNISYNNQWLDSTSTFALFVEAEDHSEQTGYDVLYVTVLPKPKRADFTIDAPLSAYKDNAKKSSLDPFPPTQIGGSLDSTYNVWCYNQPYSITFTDRNLNYTWSPRKGVQQDIYDEFTYWLSPKEISTYNISATDNAGCSSDIRTILVHPITNINISATLPESICKNDSITIKLDKGTNPTWRLNNIELKDYHEDTLVVSYQKSKYNDTEINTPSKIAIERSITPNYSYMPGSSTTPPSFTRITPPSPPPSPSYNTPSIVFAGCTESLILNIDTWLNSPEIGVVLPEDTVLIKYNRNTKSYSLCLGSNPRFDVLTYNQARRRGLSADDKRIGKEIKGNTPANTFFEWEYQSSIAALDWDSTSAWGNIRSLVPHGIEPFKLTVYNWNKACKDTVILRIRADEVPKVNFSYAPKRINHRNQNVHFKFDAGVHYTYDWDLDIDSDEDEKKVTDSDLTDPSGVKYYFEDNTKNKWIGRVVVAKDSGCRVEIPIKITRGIYIPNTFTPNGDNTNDKFLDPSTDLARLGLSITDFRFSIFTRRGQKIYQGSDGWDGTYNDSKMPNDVYYYVVEYLYDGEPVVHKGSITLLK